MDAVLSFCSTTRPTCQCPLGCPKSRHARPRSVGSAGSNNHNNLWREEERSDFWVEPTHQQLISHKTVYTRGRSRSCCCYCRSSSSSSSIRQVKIPPDDVDVDDDEQVGGPFVPSNRPTGEAILCRVEIRPRKYLSIHRHLQRNGFLSNNNNHSTVICAAQ